jgi:hypothetical protein
MSDFGAHVTVYRVDGRAPTEDDERRVESVARALQFVYGDRIGPYDGFDLRFGTARDEEGTEGVLAGLSDHFIDDDDGNDGLAPEVIIAREWPVAEQFAEDLARMLEPEFRTRPYSGYW